MYNLEIDRTHTYFVGRSELWVHNNNGCVQIARSISEGLPTARKDLECCAHAKALVSALKSRGIKGEVIELKPSGLLTVYSDMHGKPLGDPGVSHFGVVVGGQVFDNMNPSGMGLSSWLKDLWAHVSDAGGPYYKISTKKF
ncbi:MAG TPA: papain fold toxin domain-containing protein [Kofleriaceae bacterium]|nr:papain fold toxin domain-containing protein [Kofleriaceae bacterium]